MSAREQRRAACYDGDGVSLQPEPEAATCAPRSEAEASATPTVGATGRRKLVEFDRPAKIGRYTILDDLGRGGMSQVFAAYDVELDRKIALKVVRAADGDQAEYLRLFREAKAMAQLSHPNVAVVHEVGDADGMVFLALEHVDGETLHAWFESGGRSWAEVVDMMIPAGRGLAAAHERSIVHRDFKPANVMIGPSGRPQVLDFGLARSADAPNVVERHSEDRDFDADMGSDDSLRRPLTKKGAAVGTPAYMAPELWKGAGGTVASDQFAFCVTLYEGLHGKRPFNSRTIRRHGRNDLGMPPLREWRSDLPHWLRALIVRGMSWEPGERFESMAALVEALEVGRHRGRKIRGIAASAVLVCVGVGAGMWLASSPAAACDAAQGMADAHWSASRGEAIERSFSTSFPALADRTSARVAEFADAFAKDWVGQHDAACRGLAEGQQSPALTDHMYACLDGRLREFEAALHVLEDADASTVEHADDVLEAVGSLRRCEDKEAVMAGLAVPPDPETAEAVTQARAGLARVAALRAAGRPTDAGAAIDGVVQAHAETDYEPLRAEIDLARAHAASDDGDYEKARQHLTDAVFLAQQIGHDELAADASLSALYLVGCKLREHELAAFWTRYAEAEVLKSNDAELLGRLADVRGTVMRIAGDYDAAETYHRDALRRREQTYGPEHPATAHSLSNLANSLNAAGQQDEALALHERSLAIRIAHFGEAHPAVAISIQNRAKVHGETGNLEAAASDYERVLKLRVATFGPDHDDLATTYDSLGAIRALQSRFDESSRLNRLALDIYAKTLGRDHPLYIRALGNRGAILGLAGNHAEAREVFEEALEIGLRTSPPESLEPIGYAVNLARACSLSGDHGAAVKHTRFVVERLFAADAAHPAIPELLAGLVVDLVAMGRWDEAEAALTRALPLVQGLPKDQQASAHGYLTYAQALVSKAKGDPVAQWGALAKTAVQRLAAHEDQALRGDADALEQSAHDAG